MKDSITTPNATPVLEVAELVHRYGPVIALHEISLTVSNGEFVTILGPSGSGKTTLLRVIGGFENVSSAAVLKIAGLDVTNLPANHRPVATVFQHYALFPHMTVGENVEYGLKLRKVSLAERQKRAHKALDLVRLPDKYSRNINQLSGGERQRVAFARAFVVEPKILLLDEPMGALDEKLRREMQIEVRSLQRTLGTTFIQVTHSQEEALTMSDRIVVMNRGRIEQIGSPHNIFESPATQFVAEFMGLRNILTGTISRIDGDLVEIDHRSHPLVGRWTGTCAPVVGAPAFFAVHPRNLVLKRQETSDESGEGVPAYVRSLVYKGADVEIEVDTPIGVLIGATARRGEEGDQVRATWQSRRAIVAPLVASSRLEPDIRSLQAVP